MKEKMTKNTYKDKPDVSGNFGDFGGTLCSGNPYAFNIRS
jgi:hypothetical protein